MGEGGGEGWKIWENIRRTGRRWFVFDAFRGRWLLEVKRFQEPDVCSSRPRTCSEGGTEGEGDGKEFEVKGRERETRREWVFEGEGRLQKLEQRKPFVRGWARREREWINEGLARGRRERWLVEAKTRPLQKRRWGRFTTRVDRSWSFQDLKQMKKGGVVKQALGFLDSCLPSLEREKAESRRSVVVECREDLAREQEERERSSSRFLEMEKNRASDGRKSR